MSLLIFKLFIILYSHLNVYHTARRILVHPIFHVPPLLSAQIVNRKRVVFPTQRPDAAAGLLGLRNEAQNLLHRFNRDLVHPRRLVLVVLVPPEAQGVVAARRYDPVRLLVHEEKPSSCARKTEERLLAQERDR